MKRYIQVERCRWCGSNAIESHTTPKSILKAARKHVGVTNIRWLEQPNLEVQDLRKYFLLCKSCDNSFSPAENSFLRHIYEPLLTGSDEFEYDEWLIRFAISLAWKRLATGLPLLPGLTSEVIAYAEAAMIQWQGYLQNQHQEAEPYQHHLFLTKFMEKDELTDLEKTVLMSTFDSSIIPSPCALFLAATFPGCILLTIIAPTVSPPDWKTTQIHRSGRFDSNQILPGGFLLPWFQEKIDYSKNSKKTISPRQREKIKEH
jgi:hypothetical protein